MRDLKIPVVIGAFLAVVALGLGARHVYVQKRVIDPLASEAGAMPGVARVDIVPGQDGLQEVRVALAEGARVDEVYPALERAAKASLGAKLGAIVVEDDPSPRLAAAYHRIHFAVYEAASTGRFASMDREIEERLRDEVGVSYRIVVSDRHLFVHLRDDKGELVRVIPRVTAVATLGDGAGGRTQW